MKKSLTLLTIVFLALSLGYAQTGQTGKIRAQVIDEEGNPLPGVNVTITSPEMIVAEMDRVTNVNGIAVFPSLNPGTYQVVCQIEGFNRSIRQGVIVNAGVTTSIDIEMTLAVVEEEIVVVGQIPTVDKQSTTKTVILDMKFVEMIPSGRNLGEYFNMTPGVTGDTAHGSDVRGNVFSVDGMDISDSTIGLNQTWFSMDTTEEISIQQGGLSAEYGQVRGAVVNVVSKSGGNEFHGRLNMYYRGEDFQSKNTKGTPLEGQESGFRYEMEPGFSLGGPIVKDKLWFFGNISLYRQQYYVPSFPYDKEENTPITNSRPYPYIKLSFQPDQNNKLTASYRFSNNSTDYANASRYRNIDSTWETSSKSHLINLHYTRFFGSNFFIDLRGSVWEGGLFRYSRIKGPNFYEYTTYLNSNSNGWDDHNPRRHFTISADGTLFIDDFLGSHEIKMGVSFRRAVEERECTLYELEGTLWSFITTWNGSPWYAYFYQDIYWVNLLHDYGFYVNDSWNITDKLTANVGLRFDINKGMWPPQNEDEEYYELPFEGSERVDRSIKETMTIYNWKNLAPRLGLIYDLFGDGKTLLKGSFSRYYRENIATWAGRGNPNAWTYFGATVNPDYSIGYVFYVAYAGKARAPQYGYKDYELKCPYTDEFTIGIEQELLEDWSVSLRYINKKDGNIIDDADVNALDLDKLLSTGEMDWIGYDEVTGIDPYDGQTVTFYSRKPEAYVSQLYLVNPPNATRKYEGVEFTINKRFSKGWQLQASYIYAKSTGLVATDFSSSSAWGTGLYQDPNDHVNADGRFEYERRHQIKLTAMVKGPFGINIGTYTRYLAGRRYTRVISSGYMDDVNLWQGSESIYAEKRGSRGLPDLFICDLKIEKEFRIGKTTVGIFGDVFNVFNGNKATDVVTTSNNPYYTFEEMEDIQDPRIFRIGARFEF